MSGAEQGAGRELGPGDDGVPAEFDAGLGDPWDVFLADDDPTDPLPEPGDFWVEGDSG